MFRLVRIRAGIYPSRIAALCGMTPSRVGEIISGRRGLAHIDVIERVADGLRIPGAMLGLAHRPWEIPAAAMTTRHRFPPQVSEGADRAAEPDTTAGPES
ncbi:helix-turn-helix transcriptional regulator [Streptomyces sp. NPDC048845]|uniref:helix-turn-helix domain-containing protein n=1 Tax=Streptomyces sp. NPDC048845 TaxID=3155390 RepID=UPI00342D3A43